jgi:hypothetical protein
MNNTIIYSPNKGKELEISVGSTHYLRLPIKTRLIVTTDNIVDLLKEYVSEYIEPEDLLFISEKALAITQNRIVLIRDIKASKLARFLSRQVKDHRHTVNFRGFGHSTSMGMELFIQEAGYPRVLFAAAIAAITKPLGIKGLFYVICGKNAKSIDCPMSYTLWPYQKYAKRSPLYPSEVSKQIKKILGVDVVIVDANYRGVYSLGKSSNNVKEKFIQQVFRDNPAGQSDEMTPFFIIRKSHKQSLQSQTEHPHRQRINNVEI